MSLTAKQTEHIKKFCLAGISESEEYVSDLIEIGNRNLELYKAKDFLDHDDGYSGANSSEVFDTTEALTATILSVFFSADTLNLKPTGPEDEGNTDLAEKLMFYQCNRQNRGWVQMHDWVKTAVNFPISPLKITWENSEETEEVLLEGISSSAFLDMFAKLMHSEKARIVDVSETEEAPGLLDVKIEKIVKKISKPIIEALPPEEFLIVPGAKGVQDAWFCAHRRLMTLSQLREFGFPEKTVERLAAHVSSSVAGATGTATGEDPTESDLYLTRWDDIIPEWQDEDVEQARKRVVLYECYGDTDLDGDGITEPIKVFMACDFVMEDPEENTFESPPFALLSGLYRQPFKTDGLTLGDSIGQLQEISTTIIRQCLNWMYLNNNGRWIGDSNRVDLDGFIAGNVPGGVIDGDPTALQPLPLPVLDARLVKFLYEIIKEWKEDRTSVTAAQQGHDADNINKTARGMSLLFQAAHRRIEAICRVWAETGFYDFYDMLLRFNSKFLDKQVPLRLFGKWVKVGREVFNPEYDVIVDVDMGRADKQLQIQILESILKMQMSFFGKLPIVQPMHIYETAKAIVETAGQRNVDKFFMDPRQATGAQPGMMPQGPQPIPGGMQRGVPVQATGAGPGGGRPAGPASPAAPNRIPPRVPGPMQGVGRPGSPTPSV